MAFPPGGGAEFGLFQKDKFSGFVTVARSFPLRDIGAVFFILSTPCSGSSSFDIIAVVTDCELLPFAWGISLITAVSMPRLPTISPYDKKIVSIAHWPAPSTPNIRFEKTLIKTPINIAM